MNVSDANFIQKKDSVELSNYGNEAFEEEQTKNQHFKTNSNKLTFIQNKGLCALYRNE